MKILYGVQGTGNGHITRTRVMAKSLSKTNIHVDYLFSGRDPDAYFDMQAFAEKKFERGLTFFIENGRMMYLKTVYKNNLLQFKSAVKSLDLNQYDLVLTDFEPISAWAAKKHEVPCVGIGHQYVFSYPVPQEKASWMSRQVYRHFAPAHKCIALHWHHFDSPILPPIIDCEKNNVRPNKKQVLVYLPLENQEHIQNLLLPFNDHQFIIYSPEKIQSLASHITFKPLSRTGFKTDLIASESVIANAGFELSSEALSLGKRLLVRPLKGQSEQQSNAMALTHLGYGHSCQELTASGIAQFLESNKSTQLTFPNVADHIVDWIIQGMPQRDNRWYQKIWQEVSIEENQV